MTESSQITIRPATMEDIANIYELQSQAFSDVFAAAFGPKRIQQGKQALVLSHQLQGNRSLSGMHVAEKAGTIIGTITMRMYEMHYDDGLALERAFTQELGIWGSFRAINAFSQLQHRIGRRETHLTDIAVAEDSRRQGIAKLMIRTVATKAREHDKTFLSLYVSQKNTNAHTLYQSLGFRDQYIRNLWWNALILKRRRWIYMICPLM